MTPPNAMEGAGQLFCQMVSWSSAVAPLVRIQTGQMSFVFFYPAQKKRKNKTGQMYHAYFNLCIVHQNNPWHLTISQKNNKKLKSKCIDLKIAFPKSPKVHSDLKCETSTGFENENKNLRSMAFLSPFKDEPKVGRFSRQYEFVPNWWTARRISVLWTMQWTILKPIETSLAFEHFLAICRAELNFPKFNKHFFRKKVKQIYQRFLSLSSWTPQFIVDYFFQQKSSACLSSVVGQSM